MADSLPQIQHRHVCVCHSLVFVKAGGGTLSLSLVNRVRLFPEIETAKHPAAVHLLQVAYPLAGQLFFKLLQFLCHPLWVLLTALRTFPRFMGRCPPPNYGRFSLLLTYVDRAMY